MSRETWETQAAWLKRVNDENAEIKLQPLSYIVSLHYRDRFDPMRLSALEEEEFNSTVRAWLEANPAPVN